MTRRELISDALILVGLVAALVAVARLGGLDVALLVGGVLVLALGCGLELRR